jgi:hypothetical protein
VFSDPGTWGELDVAAVTETGLYNAVGARGRDCCIPGLPARPRGWRPPTFRVIEGTVIRLEVDRPHTHSRLSREPRWGPACDATGRESTGHQGGGDLATLATAVFYLHQG